jgi:predicted metal-dependent peptidase
VSTDISADTGHAFSRAVVDLTLRSPFYGHVAAGLSRVLSPERPWPVSLAVANGRFELMISPGPFAALKPAQRVVAIEHELLHAVLGHPARAADHPGDGPLFGAACDLVVNQLLSSGPPLPKAFTLASVRSLKLPKGLTAEEYFLTLKEHYRQRTPPGGGCCHAMSEHPWATSQASLQIADTQFERVAAAAAHRSGPEGIGRLPGTIAERLKALVEALESAVDWRRTLRMFSASNRNAGIRNTLRRRSKRYGTFPGIRVQRRQRLAVCVDTSGSISDQTLAEFFAEIRQIWRTGAEVRVFEVDAALQRQWPYRGDAPTECSGRGGTCFDPGLRAIRETTPRFDACLYLTDGHAPAPTVSPGVPLLWVVTPDGHIGGHLAYGRAIRMRLPSPD